MILSPIIKNFINVFGQYMSMGPDGTLFVVDPIADKISRVDTLTATLRNQWTDGAVSEIKATDFGLFGIYASSSSWFEIRQLAPTSGVPMSLLRYNPGEPYRDFAVVNSTTFLIPLFDTATVARFSPEGFEVFPLPAKAVKIIRDGDLYHLLSVRPNLAVFTIDAHGTLLNTIDLAGSNTTTPHMAWVQAEDKLFVVREDRKEVFVFDLTQNTSTAVQVTPALNLSGAITYGMDTVLTFDNEGKLYSIDPETLAVTHHASVDLGKKVYEASISPIGELWATTSDGMFRVNLLNRDDFRYFWVNLNETTDVPAPVPGQTGPTLIGADPATGTLHGLIAEVVQHSRFVGAINLTKLTNRPVDFGVFSQMAARDILEILAEAFDFICVDTNNNTLRLIDIGLDAVATLDEDDIGWSDREGIPDPKYSGSKLTGTDLPRTLAVRYMSKVNDYAWSVQTAELFSYTQGSDATVDLPMSLEDTEAKRMALRMLTRAHIESVGYSFSVSLDWIHLEPGDVLNTPIGRVRIREITMDGPAHVLNIGTVRDPGANPVFTGVVQKPATSQKSLKYIGPTDLVLVDPPALTWSDRDPRFYVGGSPVYSEKFKGAAVFVSRDEGATYNATTYLPGECLAGVALTVLPDGPTYAWDTVSTVDVAIYGGQLLSTTEDAVLTGANRLMLGKELIHFVNAQLIAPSTYRLSKLLRGDRGTEWATAGHALGDQVAVIDNNFFKSNMDLSDRGVERFYKCVTMGSDIARAEAIEYAAYSNNLVPWSVVHPEATLEDGVGWNFAWYGRARWGGFWGSGVAPTVDTDHAGYEIEVLDALDNVVRTVAIQVEEWLYTEADQTIDFGSPQAGLTVILYQISNQTGRGIPVRFTT